MTTAAKGVRQNHLVRLMVAAIALVACNPSAPLNLSSSGCVPGASQACVCVGGGSSAQVCRPDRTFAACQCGVGDGGMDATTADASDVGAGPSEAGASDLGALDTGGPASDTGLADVVVPDVGGHDVGADAPLLCSPGSSTCGADGGRLVCDASGLRWSPTPCGSGEVCSSGTCMDALSRGLIAHYAFDGNVADSSGVGAPTGVVVGALPDADRCGRSASAYRFNGSASIAFPTNPRLPVGAAPRTVALWWKTSVTTDGFRTAANWGMPVTGQRFQISSFGRVVQVAFATYGFNGSRFTSDGAWHSIVATYDGATTRLYVDGGADGSEMRTLDTVNQTLIVGRAVTGNPTDEFFIGTIDDVRIYDRDLSASEVALVASRGPCVP